MIAGLRFIGRGSEIWERGLESEAGVWNRVPGSGIGSGGQKIENMASQGKYTQICSKTSNLVRIVKSREISINRALEAINPKSGGPELKIPVKVGQ